MTLEYLYVGTYTKTGPGPERPEGIYLLSLDVDSGELNLVSTAAAGTNPSFLALSRGAKYLYAVNETGDFQGTNGGGMSALAVDPATKALTMLNSEATLGSASCYVSVSPDGCWALSANYGGGSVSALPIHADGSLGKLSDRVQHHGKGPNADRQENSHAHSVIFDPSGKFALAADLGLDRIFIYRFDTQSGSFIPHQPDGVDVHAGAGPRHMVFHPDGTTMFLTNELDWSVCVFHWDALNGQLTLVQTLSSLEESFKGENSSADIHVTGDGRFLYVSNRGRNSLTCFAIGSGEHRLQRLDISPSHGNWPRNFALDPSGKYLLAANQYSNDIAVCRIDGATGKLERTGKGLAVPSPVCLLFISE